MRHAYVAGWTSALAAAVSAAVLVLMVYRGTAEPEPGDPISLDSAGWALLISAFAGLAVSVALLAYSRFLLFSVEYARDNTRQTPSDEAGHPEAVEEASAAPDLSDLPEDERRLYEIIDAAGGEILQVKLVSSGEFSKSKVTRLLDKLEGRELIKRERHGMTNKVRTLRER